MLYSGSYSRPNALFRDIIEDERAWLYIFGLDPRLCRIRTIEMSGDPRRFATVLGFELRVEISDYLLQSSTTGALVEGLRKTFNESPDKTRPDDPWPKAYTRPVPRFR